MNCTVFGGRGFIGRNLVARLEAKGCDVWVPDRDDLNQKKKKSLGKVFYCIGLTADFRSRPFDTVAAHVETLSKILKASNYESFLYLSSTRVYSRSDSTEEDSALPVQSYDKSDLYNISKLMGESLCLSLGSANIKIARLSNVVGPGMGADNLVGCLMREALTGKVRLQTHPDSVKDYIYIDDVVKLLTSILFDGSERLYNVASGAQIAHRRWLSAIADITGCAVEIDSTAPHQSFAQINVEKIKREFGYKLKSEDQVILNTLTNQIQR